MTFVLTQDRQPANGGIVRKQRSLVFFRQLEPALLSSMGAGWQIRVDGNTLQALSNPERHRAPNI